MTHTPSNPDQLPRIQTPCPKRWDELIGGDKKRFCSECCLHVHNGAALTRAEATTLVATATERVCMRLELDPAGAPIFLEADSVAPPRTPRRRSFAARAAGWAASAAAGVLAACARTSPPPAPAHPELDPGTTNSTHMMGKVARPESMMGLVAQPEIMGDVAVPPPPPPAVRMGEISFEPAPVIEPREPAPNPR